MRLVVGIAALLAAVGFSTAARVAGRIVILEKDNKPSPDLSDAVLYLETPAAVTTAARPVTVESPSPTRRTLPTCGRTARLDRAVS